MDQAAAKGARPTAGTGSCQGPSDHLTAVQSEMGSVNVR